MTAQQTMKHYTQSHEYLAALEGCRYRVGLSDYAREELGDIVFVELKEAGTSLAAGEELGAIDSVKAAVEVYAPVAGTIVSVNQQVIDDPETLSCSSGGAPWLVELEIADQNDLKSLLSEEEYQAHIKALSSSAD